MNVNAYDLFIIFSLSIIISCKTYVLLEQKTFIFYAVCFKEI